MRAARWNRKLHRYGAVIIAIPLLVVIVSGLALQLKKEVAWIQPKTKTGKSKVPSISFDAVLEAARNAELPSEARVNEWADIDRMDVRPSKGIVKVQTKNSYEVQVDLETGEVLQVSYRRSDLFESLHDGSWFHEKSKLFIFLPSAVILLMLWVTGVYLWFLPHRVRRRKRRKATPSA